MNNKLYNSKILLLAPKFYGYENEIIKKIEELGGIVTYINDDPDIFRLTIIHAFKKIHISSSFLINCFENRLLKQINKNKYDYILIINGWAITSNFTSKLRQKCLMPSGRMILYYWDTLEVLKDDILRWKDFDDIYSFDNKDCIANPNFKLLPLFFCDQYWRPENKISNYDIGIVGVFKLSRLQLIKNLQNINTHVSIKKYIFINLQQFIIHKLFRKKYWHVKFSELEFSSLDFNDVVFFYNDCKAVLDIPSPKQNGLTIRTIETLALHKKLITTNKNIEGYDFYNPNDIYIIDIDHPQLPPLNWFNTNFSISDSIIHQYNIEQWINNLLL